MEALAREVTAVERFLAATGVGPAVLAVSGGGDSLALMEILAAADHPAPVHVAHHDHRTRTEGTQDAEHVEALARERGLPFHVTRSEATGPRSEDALRRERYDALAGVADAVGACLLTAHTEDDQAETVLAQLLRGAGPGGVRGIARRTLWRVPGGEDIVILRPLLRTSRRSLREILRGRGVAWIDDPADARGENLRARLRHTVFPRLTEATSRDPVKSLARFARSQERVVALLDSLLPDDPGREDLAQLPDAVLDHWLRQRGVATSDQIEWCRDAIRSNTDEASRDLAGGLRVEIRQSAVRIGRGLPAALAPLPGLELRTVEGLPQPVPAGRCFLDPARTPLPLAVRWRKDGDRFRPLGGRGSRLVSDLLTDLKIPPGERGQVPIVVTASGEIAWVAPHRVDDRFAAGPDSEAVLEVRIGPPEPGASG